MTTEPMTIGRASSETAGAEALPRATSSKDERDPFRNRGVLFRKAIRRLRWFCLAKNAPRRRLDRQRLIAELHHHALVHGDVTLSSGSKAKYYVDAKRAALTPEAFALIGRLVAVEAWKLRATAVGGLSIGADPVVGATLGTGIDIKGFLVRKERKPHGLQRWIEGPELQTDERCIVVDDVVTTGGSVIQAIERLKEQGVQVVGVITILDRLAGGEKPISDAADGAPYRPLTTIDEVFPDRPDR